MSASQILLTGHGPEDRWLTESPNRTYFEGKYPPRSNRFRETYEVPFDNQEATFGATGRCTIPVKGDYLTRLTLRSVFPPIYPTQSGEYVFPTPSSQVGASVYANMGLTLVVADGVTLTANTVGNHYMSIGTAVTLSGTTYSIFDLDGTYTVTSIPTANSFTCSTTLAGISYNGTMSFVGIACGDIISYFSTRNSNLWVNNLTNKTWQITGISLIGTYTTFTTQEPSNFPIGSQVLIKLGNYDFQSINVTSSSQSTFTSNIILSTFVSVGYNAGSNGVLTYSNDGTSWSSGTVISASSLYSITYGNGIYVSVGYPNYQVYSTNGTIWQSATTQVAGDWNAVTYGNGKYVTVGYSGVQAFSTDGTNWQSAATQVAGSWYAVTYGNGKYVAVGFSGIQAFSTDGTKWQ